MLHLTAVSVSERSTETATSSNRTSRWLDLLYRCHHVIRGEVDVIRSQMARNGITMLFGTASFVPIQTRFAWTSATMIAGQPMRWRSKTHHVMIAVGLPKPARPASVRLHARWQSLIRQQ